MINTSPPEPKKHPSPREVFGILLVTFSLSLLLAALWSDLESKTRLLVAEFLVGIPAVAYAAWKRLDFKATFRLRPVKWQVLPVSVLIGAGIAVATEEISRLIQGAIPMDSDILAALSDMMRAGNDRELVILILAAVIVASAVEEGLFRGMLQGTLERRGDVTRAVMATALIFAFIHFNPWWVIEILLMAVLMGVLAWKTDSIFPPMVVHATNNAIALVMVNVPEERMNWLLSGEHIRPLYLILAVAVIVEGFRLVYRIQDKSSISFQSSER